MSDFFKVVPHILLGLIAVVYVSRLGKSQTPSLLLNSAKKPPTSRQVHNMDALAWLEKQTIIPGCVITSLPNFTEVNMTPAQWKIWFQKTIELIMTKLDSKSCAIFYQSDCRVTIHEEGDKKKRQCDEWIDKGYLVMKCAENIGLRVLWKKIVLTHPPGTPKSGRAGFSHMICVAPMSLSVPIFMDPDVMMRGDTMWCAGAGLNAMSVAVKFVLRIGGKCVVDPFCGYGSALAVANYFGIDAVGVELHMNKCKKAESLLVIKEDGELKFSGVQKGK